MNKENQPSLFNLVNESRTFIKNAHVIQSDVEQFKVLDGRTPNGEKEPIFSSFYNDITQVHNNFGDVVANVSTKTIPEV